MDSLVLKPKNINISMELLHKQLTSQKHQTVKNIVFLDDKLIRTEMYLHSIPKYR
jgi:hypothetical protein